MIYKVNIVSSCLKTEKTFLVDADKSVEDGIIRILWEKEITDTKAAGEYPEIVLDLDKVMEARLSVEIENKIAENIIKKAVEEHPEDYKMQFSYNEEVSAYLLEKTFREYSEVVKEAKADGSYPDHLDDFGTFLYETLLEEWISYEAQDFAIESDIRDSIGYKNWQTVAEYLKRNSLYMTEAIQEQGGKTDVCFDLDDVLGEYKVDIMFATGQEQDLDMGSIPDMLHVGRREYPEHDLDNALSFVICQQGHTIGEFIKSLREGKQTGTDFISSAVYEASNLSAYPMAEFTVLATLKGKDMIDVLDMAAKGEGTLQFPADTMSGLFNEWDGSGSVFGIVLEKPLCIPASMVRGIMFEREVPPPSRRNYAVGDTYSFSQTCWKGTVSRCSDEDTISREAFEKELQDTRIGG